MQIKEAAKLFAAGNRRSLYHVLSGEFNNSVSCVKARHCFFMSFLFFGLSIPNRLIFPTLYVIL